MASDSVNALFAELIEKLEDEPSFDVELFLREHASHSTTLRARLEKLRRAGFVGTPPNAGNVLHEMRERFGVSSSVRASRPGADDTPSSGELLPSRVVGGRYRILAEIGRGGMGRVFRALDIDLEREVALKVVDLEPVGSADTPQRRAFLARFLTEAQLTAQLEHPSIVPLHDLGIDRTGQLYYTMKLVEGRTLEEEITEWHADLAAGRPFPTAELLRIVLQICDALALANERGVIHRDLKPSNVMIGRFGEVHVMDWGLAKLLGASEPAPSSAQSARSKHDSPSVVGDVLGTPSHMAPEQAAGDPALLDQRVDVYGVGAILHHALHSSPPNRPGETGASSRSPSWIPPELNAVLRRALDPTAAGRYSSVAALSQDLRAFLEARPGSAWRDGPARRLVKWTRRQPGRAVLVGASAVLVLIVLLAWAVNQRTAEHARLQRARADAAEERSRSSDQLLRAASTEVALKNELLLAEHDRSLIGNLIQLLHVRAREWDANEYGQQDGEGMPATLETILAGLREAEFPLDGPESVEVLLTRLERLREIAPDLRAKALTWIRNLSDMADQIQLPVVKLFCEGRSPREVKKNLQLWTRWCAEHRALIDFMPRLDALMDAIVTDPWERDVLAARREHFRNLVPWPQELLDLELDDPLDQFSFGMTIYSDVDPKAATRSAELLQACVDKIPDPFWAHFMLGLLKGGQLPAWTDYDASIEHLYAAVGLNPRAFRAWSNLGGVLLIAGRDVEALHALERAVALQPHDALALDNLAEALRRARRLDEALELHDRSMALDGTRSRSFFNRGLVHQDLGDLEAAVADYRRALELDRSYTKAWGQLGLALARLKNPEASEALEHALRLGLDSEEIRSALGSLRSP